jgi:hypothetical protein
MTLLEGTHLDDKFWCLSMPIGDSVFREASIGRQSEYRCELPGELSIKTLIDLWKKRRSLLHHLMLLEGWLAKLGSYGLLSRCPHGCSNKCPNTTGILCSTY